MKNKTIKKVMGMAIVMMVSAAILVGCGQDEEPQNIGTLSQGTTDTGAGTDTETQYDDETKGAADGQTTDSQTVDNQTAGSVSELEVRFGDEGEPFMMQLLDNETAAAIARYVGTSDWRLPIYERDEDADYDVMQYYDVSSRYDIPSNPETVTSEKAGEVYYSDPNRIVLFYHDAEITGEYLGWNAKNLTLVNCTIESLQGMCYIDNLVMKNCRLLNTTLAFEYSTVDAEIHGEIDSVMNPSGGSIKADYIGELIIEKDKVDPDKTVITCSIDNNTERMAG